MFPKKVQRLFRPQMFNFLHVRLLIGCLMDANDRRSAWAVGHDKADIGTSWLSCSLALPFALLPFTSLDTFNEHIGPLSFNERCPARPRPSGLVSETVEEGLSAKLLWKRSHFKLMRILRKCIMFPASLFFFLFCVRVDCWVGCVRVIWRGLVCSRMGLYNTTHQLGAFM